MISSMNGRVPMLLWLCAALLASGCAKSADHIRQDRLEKLIPADLMAKVDETVSFTDLRSTPGSYVGRVVMLNGVALNARLMKDGTEIEILQVPTETGLTPSDQRTRSEGRFLAVHSKGFLDPAIIERDSPVTVVGEVKGATRKQLDDGLYDYPVLDVNQLISWNDIRRREQKAEDDLDYYGRYGGSYGFGSAWDYGYGGPIWAPNDFYPYGYYGPWYGLPRVPSAPAPQPFQKKQ